MLKNYKKLLAHGFLIIQRTKSLFHPSNMLLLCHQYVWNIRTYFFSRAVIAKKSKSHVYGDMELCWFGVHLATSRCMGSLYLSPITPYIWLRNWVICQTPFWLRSWCYTVLLIKDLFQVYKVSQVVLKFYRVGYDPVCLFWCWG